MDGFQKRRQRKKNDILEAALSLFMEYGEQKVSIAEIAQKANVSQVTIYNYFDSKDNLLHETLIYYVEKSWKMMEDVLNSNISFPEKIKQLIFNKKQAANQINPDFYNFFMKEYATGTSYVENFYKEKALPRMISLFNEGKEKGFIDSELSNEAILFYIEMIRQQMQREEVYQRILPMAEDITQLFFYGITGKQGDDA